MAANPNNPNGQPIIMAQRFPNAQQPPPNPVAVQQPPQRYSGPPGPGMRQYPAPSGFPVLINFFIINLYPPFSFKCLKSNYNIKIICIRLFISLRNLVWNYMS